MAEANNDPGGSLSNSEADEHHGRSPGGQLYWILPIVVATFAVTLWLLLNPRWGGDVAAIVVIPINVAAVLIPILLRYSAKGSPTWGRRKAKKLRIAIAFTCAALVLSGGIYWVTREPDPREYLSGTVNIGINMEEYPGWSAVEGGEYRGFDIELTEFLAGEFGFTPRYVPVDRKGRLERLEQEDDDDPKLVIANFSITPDREEKIDFAGPYFEDHQGFYTYTPPGEEPAENLLDIKSEDRNSLCVPDDSTAKERLENLGWEIDPEPSLAKCIERLLHDDRTLAVSTDAAILEAYAYAQDITPPSAINLGLEKYGVGIPNNRPKLCKELNMAIEKFLLDRWDTAFREHLPGLAPDDRRPTLAECKSSAAWG